MLSSTFLLRYPRKWDFKILKIELCQNIANSLKFFKKATRCLVIEHRVRYSAKILLSHPFLLSRQLET